MKQHTIRIPIHSMIDLITNSSTEIFVDSESSIKPAKELLAELLRMEGSEKTIDEVFTFSLEYGDTGYLAELLIENMEDHDPETYATLGFTGDWKNDDRIAEQYIADYQSGKIKEPDYIEELMNDNEVNIDTNLVVRSNDPKYDHFLKLLEKFLYSPDYAEGYQ